MKTHLLSTFTPAQGPALQIFKIAHDVFEVREVNSGKLVTRPRTLDGAWSSLRYAAKVSQDNQRTDRAGVAWLIP